MNTANSDADWSGVSVTHADMDGLGLRDGEASWAEPWSAVSGIQAARVPAGASTVLILAIGVGIGTADERTLLVTEFDPIWDALGDAIHRELTGVPPPATWQAHLTAPGKVSLFASDRL